MSTLSTTSALGLDLGSMTLPTHPSTLSANGSFAVESYTPTQGCAGDILTVTLAFFESTLPINHQDQAYDFRLIVNDKKLRSKVEHDSDGKLVIRALLSTSLASLSGLVLMGLHIYRDNILFDYCNFGRFNLARMPMSKFSCLCSITCKLTHCLTLFRLLRTIDCTHFLKAGRRRYDPHTVSRAKEEQVPPRSPCLYL